MEFIASNSPAFFRCFKFVKPFAIIYFMLYCIVLHINYHCNNTLSMDTDDVCLNFAENASEKKSRATGRYFEIYH